MGWIPERTRGRGDMCLFWQIAVALFRQAVIGHGNRNRRHANSSDPTSIELGHLEAMCIDDHLVADAWNLAEPRDNETGDGLVRPLRSFDAGLVGEVLDIEKPVDGRNAEGPGSFGPLHEVVLVLDVTDELLDEILESDNAGGSAVLVLDDG